MALISRRRFIYFIISFVFVSLVWWALSDRSSSALSDGSVPPALGGSDANKPKDEFEESVIEEAEDWKFDYGDDADFPTRLPDISPKVKPDEKFLAFIPHSGFHNQRIILENALLLAAYTNRTLLLPNAFLGTPMPYLRYEKLYERLLMQTKRGLDHCPHIPPHYPLPQECLCYFDWADVPWDFFYDLTVIKKHVRIMWQPDLSDQWIFENLNVKKSDIHYVADSDPLEFRVYDDPKSKTALGRYKKKIEISQFQEIDRKVIHFGSIFGSYRVLAQTPDHLKLLRMIRENLIFRNPTLMRTADRIVAKLGGAQTYVGLHIRTGDGLFARRATITIDDIYHALVDNLTDLADSEIDFWEGGTHEQDRIENEAVGVRLVRPSMQDPPSLNDPMANEGSNIRKLPSDLGELSPYAMPCIGPHNERTKRFTTRIYIATDTPRPRGHPLLHKIFNTFPCAFVLDDVWDELDELRALEIPEERVSLEQYLISMVDAVVAAKGNWFLGTKDSTFSAYIDRQLHPVYTGKIVEEGKGKWN